MVVKIFNSIRLQLLLTSKISLQDFTVQGKETLQPKRLLPHNSLHDFKEIITMYITEKINTDISNIASCGGRIFARPWDEEDCDYFFHLIFDNAVRNSRSSKALEDAVIGFGIIVNMMVMHFLEKEE